MNQISDAEARQWEGGIAPLIAAAFAMAAVVIVASTLNDLYWDTTNRHSDQQINNGFPGGNFPPVSPPPGGQRSFGNG